MKQVTISEMRQVPGFEAQVAFAARAVKAFAEHPECTFYSPDPPFPGCNIAFRWGTGDDCAVVMKLDGNAEVLNYANIAESDNQLNEELNEEIKTTVSEVVMRQRR